MGKVKSGNERAKNSLYKWKTFPEKALEFRKKLALKIIEDAVKIHRHNQNLSNLFNGDREDGHSISCLEEDYNGFYKPFDFGMIEGEEHQNELLKIAYAHAANEQLTPVKAAVIIEESWRETILEF